jgi:hydrogenase expression/formation protein HypE
MSARNGRISPLHGAGGEHMETLLREHILKHFTKRSAGRIGLDALDDGATIATPDRGELVVTTDSHVVTPIFFPGGDIGRLAAAGAINDLAVMGAKPIALSLGLIVEEDFPIDDLDRILDSLGATLDEVGAALVCGDTKVMGKGELDGIVLNTTGFGVAAHAIGDADLTVGDRIIVTGTIGDHGMALIATREEFRLKTTLESDVVPIWPMIESALQIGGVKAMKDPTRGGLAAVLNDMARKSDTCLEIEEEAIPIREEVHALSEMLGISPLEVANEGKAVLIVEPAKAEAVLTALQADPLGADAAIVGEVTDEYPKRVILNTGVGGRRFLEMPLGDPIPRIC